MYAVQGRSALYVLARARAQQALFVFVCAVDSVVEAGDKVVGMNRVDVVAAEPAPVVIIADTTWFSVAMLYTPRWAISNLQHICNLNFFFQISLDIFQLALIRLG